MLHHKICGPDASFQQICPVSAPDNFIIAKAGLKFQIFFFIFIVQCPQSTTNAGVSAQSRTWLGDQRERARSTCRLSLLPTAGARLSLDVIRAARRTSAGFPITLNTLSRWKAGRDMLQCPESTTNAGVSAQSRTWLGDQRERARSTCRLSLLLTAGVVQYLYLACRKRSVLSMLQKIL